MNVVHGSPPPGMTSISPQPMAIVTNAPQQQMFGVVPHQVAAPPAPQLFGGSNGVIVQQAAPYYPQNAASKPAQQKSRAAGSGSAPGQPNVINQLGQIAKLTTIGAPLNDKLETVDATGQTQAGVGIFFQQEPNSWVYVASIVPNSSADRCGLIRGDDELIQVDNVKITASETLADVRLFILGAPGSYVALSFRRPGGQYGNGNRGEFYYYDVELMRGSVDFIQQSLQAQSRGVEGVQERGAPGPDYSQYELEIARLRDEIEALRHQAEEPAPEDPRVAPLEEELRARMDDLSRFEKMLMRSQERASEAERARREAVESLTRLKDENEKLQVREAEHHTAFEHVKSKFGNHTNNLEQMKRQLSQELEAEKKLSLSVEEQLAEVTAEIANLRSVAASHVGRHTDTRARLRQGHATIREALQAQEQQLATLADVIPALDMVHSSLISSIALDPVRLQTYNFQVPKATPRMGSAADVAPPLLSSSISGAVTGAIDYSQIKIDAAVLERIRAANAPVKPKVEEDIA